MVLRTDETKPWYYITMDDESLGSWGTLARARKFLPSVEQLYDIAKYLDVDVRELLVATK